MGGLNDLTGQVHGDFIVLFKSGPNFWRVRCQTCGVEEDRNKVAVTRKKRPCQTCKFNRWDDERKKKQAESESIGEQASISK